MATGPEHYRTAERPIDQAGTWMNADTGWKAHLSQEERIALRSACVEGLLPLGVMRTCDARDWRMTNAD